MGRVTARVSDGDAFMYRMAVARRAGWILISTVVLLFAVTNVRFFNDADFSTALQPQVYVDNALIIRAHIFAGTLSILTGPMQFWSTFRDRNRNWHRLIGKIYLVGAAFGSVSALYVAWISFGGFSAHVGFFVLALGWGGTTLLAYRRIRAGHWMLHREWMIRSYSLALGVLGIRAWYALFRILGVENEPSFAASAWLGWVTMLLVAEVYLGWWRRRTTVVVGPEPIPARTNS